MKTILSSRKERYLAKFTIFLVMVALIAGVVSCGGGEQEEEEEEEYITTWDGLNAIRNNLDGDYVLANDLDSTPADYDQLASKTANNRRGWEPIGDSDNPFTGSFDGDGHTITGLYISRPDEDYVGLFGYVKRGVVKNVGLVEVDVTGRNETGALVGYNERGTVGGDLGLPNSTYSTGRVASYWSVGGLVGCNWDGTVSLCQSSANVSHTSGECYRVGGLVGTNYGDVVLCKYSGNVTGVHEVGGMVGLNGGLVLVPLSPEGRVIGCQGNYTVTGRLFVGGEVGTNLGYAGSSKFQGLVNGKTWVPKSYMALNEGTAGNSYSSDSAPDGSYAGLLVGWNSGTMTDSIGVGDVIGAEYIGGGVGYIDSGGRVDGCLAVATVEGTAYVGPLWGYKHPAATMTNSAGLTTAEGMDIGPYKEAGWDICAVAAGEVNTACTWNIVPGQTYPFLSGKELEQYNLTISSTEGGAVTSPGEGPFTYYEGRVVNLVAEADEGYQFVNWTGNVGTVANIDDATTVITMNDDYSITANFASGDMIPLKNPGSFVQMTIGDIESLDPALGYETFSCEQMSYIYETLIFYDGTKSNEFVPVLATEWNLSADKLTYRFKIRKGVKFQEGGDLTPSDVEYSFKRAMVQDRDGGRMRLIFEPLLGVDSSSETTFAAISHAVEVDGDWVVFHLSDPSWANPFLQILCGTWASIVDKEWCIARGDWPGTEATWQDPKWHNPTPGTSVLHKLANGTGPWRLEIWDPGVQIRLEKNANYWRGSVPFDWVITQVVEEWTARKLALLAGDADFVYVPRANIGELDSIAGLNVYQNLPELSTDALFFNFNIASVSAYIGSGKLDGAGIPSDFFSDVDVRKGFSYAFDWATYIKDAMMGEAKQAYSPIIDGLTYWNPSAPHYTYDLAKATEYWKAAWGGQVWEKGFRFTLLYSTGDLRGKAACEILAANLAAINPKFHVSVQPLEWSTIWDHVSGGLVPMFHAGWMADYPDPDNFVTPFMASWGSYAALQNYGNPEADALITEGATSVDPVVRQAIYHELQQIYYDDAPSIMLAQPLGRRYFTKYIKGFYFNPMIPGQPGPLYHMSKSP